MPAAYLGKLSLSQSKIKSNIRRVQDLVKPLIPAKHCENSQRR